LANDWRDMPAFTQKAPQESNNTFKKLKVKWQSCEVTTAFELFFYPS